MRMMLLLSLLLTLLNGIGQAADGYRTLTSAELNAMMDRKVPELVLIDSRTAEEYQEAHIPGAVSIPWAKMEKDPSLLSCPKNAKIVFYCTGAG